MSLQSNFSATADQIEKQIESVFSSLEENAKGKPGERLVAVSKDVSLTAVKQWREFNENALEVLEQLATTIRTNAEKVIGASGDAFERAESTAKAVSKRAKDAAEEIADEVEEQADKVAATARKAAGRTSKSAKKAAGKAKTEAKKQGDKVAAMTKSLSSMTKAELIDYAKANDIKVTTSMTKAEIKKTIDKA